MLKSILINLKNQYFPRFLKTKINIFPRLFEDQNQYPKSAFFHFFGPPKPVLLGCLSQAIHHAAAKHVLEWILLEVQTFLTKAPFFPKGWLDTCQSPLCCLFSKGFHVSYLFFQRFPCGLLFSNFSLGHRATFFPKVDLSLFPKG